MTIFYNSTDGKTVAQELRNHAGPAVYAVCCDMESRDAIRTAVRRTLELMEGWVDILVNAAGINRQYDLDEFPVEEWDRVINVNLNAAVYCTQLVGRVMKDLGGILMQYGYVYVAQVAMGADQAQTLRALREAEAYPGPSIVIAYCPCLEQHIKAGMSCSQTEMKKAVECGCWQLYRYDPRRTAEGKNPFQLDAPPPDTERLMDFLMGENRFASLKNSFPEKAAALYAKEIADVRARYDRYRRLAEREL